VPAGLVSCQIRSWGCTLQSFVPLPWPYAVSDAVPLMTFERPANTTASGRLTKRRNAGVLTTGVRPKHSLATETEVCVSNAASPMPPSRSRRNARGQKTSAGQAPFALPPKRRRVRDQPLHPCTKAPKRCCTTCITGGPHYVDRAEAWPTCTTATDPPPERRRNASPASSQRDSRCPAPAPKRRCRTTTDPRRPRS
jgi:hypothetical protein